MQKRFRMLMYNNYSVVQDNELLCLCQSGNESAFSEMYNRYKRSLISFANAHLENIAIAEDIVHDVFLSLYSRRINLKIEISVYAYLLKSIKYKIINLRRKQIVQQKYAKNIFICDKCENDFAKEDELKITTSRLKIAINKMPLKCKEAFILSREVGLSQKEIAQKMSISCSTVEKHIVKALKIVRQELMN
ncbi:sigma-70 family RNA polymerase sigma factor [Rhizosphaericola mali]|uniref:Sigma-70 family RNA polymerase sigma factor n=1 Tax=Rhizosphaericola mali TaxID=2545455 RepID=A0A5P2FZ90_9BACT|nr:sigma-70 family RNA polymerase sigma factor [Rhizosphaericola mali]QES87129.1 sigma-70 family RNA polymerase sigma factor [Rhizosphaericola mali]